MSTNCLHAPRRPSHDPMPPPGRARWAAALRFYDPRPADATIARAPGVADVGATATLATKNLFRPTTHEAMLPRGARA